MTSKLEQQLSTWQGGIESELYFWRDIIAARGGPYADDFRYRLDPNGVMDPEIGNEITTSPIASARILDVGSGPMTRIGKVFRGQRPEIVATDPLAPFYLQLLSEYSVDPLVKVQQAFAEDLSSYFPPESFDVTVCVNALDHAFTPLRALREMLEVTRIGGAVVLQHRPNEAENESYSGLHQWNFENRDGRFIIWSKFETIDVNSELEGIADVAKVSLRHDMLVVVLRRIGPTGCADPARMRERIAGLLSAMLSIAARTRPERDPK